MTGIGNKGRAFNMAMHHANIDALTFWRFIHAWVNNEFARVMLKVVAVNRPLASVMNFDSSQRSHQARYVVLSTVVVLKHEELDMVVKASHRLGVRPVIKDASSKLGTKHTGYFTSTAGVKGKFGVTPQACWMDSTSCSLTR
jgi:hypothetical protein